MSMQEREGSLELALNLGLFENEYNLIITKMGRTPTKTEIAMFSGMWSEHCSYKNSINLLKTLYSESDRLLAAPGEENAGALRLNEEYAVVFKVESHNHPSALEPYQGAATGVGGIMRDVFTMGARPVLSLNSLRFGNLDQKKNRWLFREVVKGVGDYGNSLGIACGGGEVFFHPSYSKNPLVNAMTVGISRVGKMASSRASGPGNSVIYVGAKTGKDGIHGASFASKEISDESAAERSAVQVGDPFMEKQLMEATLECIEKGLVVAIQDMGAAGLISSSSEMSASGGVGMNIYLDKIPAREDNMEPFEFLLSESQERMLAIAVPEKTEEIIATFRKWELDAVVIGEVTDTGNLKIFHHNRLYADVPARYLTVNKDGAPRYTRETRKPQSVSEEWENPRQNGIKFFAETLQSGKSEDVEGILKKVLSHPNIASKKFIYEQYDTDIGIHRYSGPGYNAGLYRIFDSGSSLAVSIDGNGTYVKANPYYGTMHTVAEGYRNISSTGAEPLGITNCLNFANPFKPENYYYFERSIRGMSQAAETFRIPITGGNVSFYNESEDGPVLPTPAIGMVGYLEDNSKRAGIRVNKGSGFYLTGYFLPGLEASQYAYIMDSVPAMVHLPEMDLEKEMAVATVIRNAIREALVETVMDLSAGGMMTAILRIIFHEMNAGTGFVLSPDWNKIAEEQSINADMLFFGETAHSYITVVSPEKKEQFREMCGNIPTLFLGEADESGILNLQPGMEFSLEDLKSVWASSIQSFLMV